MFPGKDKSVFVTREDVSEAAVVSELVEEDHHGIILPNGDINWDCPCLGGMAQGTCGQQFKDAFSCFHYRLVLVLDKCDLSQVQWHSVSEEEEKGVDCIPQFKGMQECFFKYPEEYGKFTEDEEEGAEEKEGVVEQTAPPPTEPRGELESGNEPQVKSDSGSEQVGTVGQTLVQS